jgi:hypothetical protein
MPLVARKMRSAERRVVPAEETVATGASAGEGTAAEVGPERAIEQPTRLERKRATTRRTSRGELRVAAEDLAIVVEAATRTDAGATPVTTDATTVVDEETDATLAPETELPAADPTGTAARRETEGHAARRVAEGSPDGPPPQQRCPRTRRSRRSSSLTLILIPRRSRHRRSLCI